MIILTIDPYPALRCSLPKYDTYLPVTLTESLSLSVILTFFFISSSNFLLCIFVSLSSLSWSIFFFFDAEEIPPAHD
jgi:hypothetical protein